MKSASLLCGCEFDDQIRPDTFDNLNGSCQTFIYSNGI